MAVTEALIKKYMDKYHCSAEEAKEICEWDDDETMETEETRAATERYKEFSRTNHDAHTFVKRERKPREVKKNPTKIMLIEEIRDLLVEMEFEDVVVTNEQKYITFRDGDDRYEINLIQKRPPKKA